MQTQINPLKPLKIPHFLTAIFEVETVLLSKGIRLNLYPFDTRI